jgi:hypothetical protein
LAKYVCASGNHVKLTPVNIKVQLLLATQYKLENLKASKIEKYGPSNNTLLQAPVHINIAKGCNCSIMISITTEG